MKTLKSEVKTETPKRERKTELELKHTRKKTDKTILKALNRKL